jgi:hypothetical protein
MLDSIIIELQNTFHKPDAAPHCEHYFRPAASAAESERIGFGGN